MDCWMHREIRIADGNGFNCFVLSVTGNTPLHLAVMLGRKGICLFYVCIFLMFESYIGYQKCIILIITDD